MEILSKLYKFLFGDWDKWKDVSCAESLGYHIVIQTRVEKRTGKRQVRQIKFWVNDAFKKAEINKNMFLN